MKEVKDGERIQEPIERLATKWFLDPHSGECKHCGGIVKMRRADKTLELLPDFTHCLRCGQHYYVAPSDLTQFCGGVIGPYRYLDETIGQMKMGFRTIDTPWKPSKE